MTRETAAALTLDDWILLCEYALSQCGENYEKELVLYNLLNLLTEEHDALHQSEKAPG